MPKTLPGLSRAQPMIASEHDLRGTPPSFCQNDGSSGVHTMAADVWKARKRERRRRNFIAARVDTSYGLCFDYLGWEM